MIKALVDKVATSLVTLNSTWLTEIRTIGYQLKQDSKTIVFGKDNIGMTDVKGNSGYIRFRSDQNYSVSELPQSERRSTCETIGQRISLDLRLVLVLKTEIEYDVVFWLTAQMNSLTFTDAAFANRNVKVRVQSAGSNTLSNVLNETGEKDLNNELRVIYIDFRIFFDWIQRCDNPNIVINMDNCESTSFVDFGCTPVCDGVTLYQDSTYTGTMTLKTMFNGQSVLQSFAVIDGEPIVVPTENLNASYTYIITLLDANGEAISILSDDPTPEEFDTLKITVNP